MNRQSSQSYVHRPNKDGTYDSICTQCYVTVATTRNETELDMHESSHICIADWPYQVSVNRHDQMRRSDVAPRLEINRGEPR